MPLEVTFSRMEPSDRITSPIVEEAASLGRFQDLVLRCDVRVEVVGLAACVVIVELETRGGEIVTSHDAVDPSHPLHDVEIAIRDAFSAAVRRLDDHRQSAVGRRASDIDFAE